MPNIFEQNESEDFNEKVSDYPAERKRTTVINTYPLYGEGYAKVGEVHIKGNPMKEGDTISVQYDMVGNQVSGFAIVKQNKVGE